jgi:hypothetical protein
MIDRAIGAMVTGFVAELTREFAADRERTRADQQAQIAVGRELVAGIDPEIAAWLRLVIAPLSRAQFAQLDLDDANLGLLSAEVDLNDVFAL